MSHWIPQPLQTGPGIGTNEPAVYVGIAITVAIILYIIVRILTHRHEEIERPEHPSRIDIKDTSRHPK